VDFYVLEEISDFTLNYEEKLNGGISNWTFFGFYSGFHVRPLRRGDTMCFFVHWVNLFGVGLVGWDGMNCYIRV
jgi:hypothetical protein